MGESMIEDQSKGSLSNMATNTRLDDQFTACADYALKPRKPYTITKQRKKWTQEEHKKFLAALKLHGRAWRRIEEHVGNKTAVQIRSHAQKFFSKVVRESSSVHGTEVEHAEIPPPRAKRKPTHHYPRKVSVPLKKGACLARSSSPYSSGSNQESVSPTSVLSVGGADSCLPKVGSLLDETGSSHSAQENDNSSPTKNGEKRSVNDGSPESLSTQSLKLFGKTVFVTDSAKPSSSDVITTLPWNLMPIRAPECPPTTPCWSVYGDSAYPFPHWSNRVEQTTQDH